MTIKPVFELKHTNYKLSIQLSLNGFSFCIANSSGKIINSYSEFSEKTTYSEEELKELLDITFNTKPELQAQFQTVEVIYSNDLYVFVPKAYFDENHKELYFKYSIKTLATDYISYDELVTAPIINLFIPYVNINNSLIERFNEFDFKHSSAVLVNYLLQRDSLESVPKIHLYFYAQHFDIIITKGKTLLLCNTFLNQSKEDVLYYLLFCMEQLELSTETTEVNCLNKPSDELFEILYTYIRNISKPESDNSNLLHRIALNV